MRWILLITILISLSGCKLFDGYGTDGSELVIDHRCEIDLKQRARTAGEDDAEMMEKVEVKPDCTTIIDFNQTVGDGKPVEAKQDEAATGG